MMSIPEAIAVALQHYEAGRLPQAVQLYTNILQQQPDQIDALQMLGIAAVQYNNMELAIECFTKVVKLNSLIPSAHCNLGNAYQEQRRYQEAISCYQKAVALDPACIEAHYNLGNIFQEQGQPEAAIYHYQQALVLKPNSLKLHNNLGFAFETAGELEAAIRHYQRALVLNSNSPEVHFNLGNSFIKQGQLEAAIYHYQQALFLNPSSSLLHYIVGRTLQEQGQLEASIHHYQQALALNPNYLDAHNNLGVALMAQGQLEPAVIHYQQALALDPNHPDVHYNLSTALLLTGDICRGFAEYEWRWQTKGTSVRTFAQPYWNGSSLDDKTLLLYGEQGFGDQIQFIRYVPLIAQYGGNVIVECAYPLIRLFRTVPGIKQLIATGEPLPEFDIQAPLMSVPRILGTTLETIPAQIPYLQTSEISTLELETSINYLKVGVVWSGSSHYKANHHRSCRLHNFSKLFAIPNIKFYSLQKGPQAEELVNFYPQTPVEDLGQQLTDFADTACVLKQLDLLISVDTAIVHLAGALGIPTWVLLGFTPDWRWLLNREDSPWYPTLRLFRQSQPNNWTSVFEQVEQALRYHAQQSARG